MSATDSIHTADQTSELAQTLRIYGVVLGVGVCCGLAIVTVYELTKPVIRNNQIASRAAAVFEVLPNATSSQAYRWDGQAKQFEQTSQDAEGDDVVFAGFDDDGKLLGLAIETKGMGYQDFIRIIYGYVPETETIIGFRVLESRETPGLGDRIEKDQQFLANFDALDVSVDPDTGKVANPIQFVKSGAKSSPWQIDGITGATISSKATADMLCESSLTWMPRAVARQADFEGGQTGSAGPVSGESPGGEVPRTADQPQGGNR